MKKLFAIILSVAMILCMMPAMAFADVSYAVQSGENKYETLAEAIQAVTDDTETVITLIDDVTIIGNAGVTIAAGQNIVLDLNGHTLSNSVNENKSSQVITNKGTLTITDSSVDGKGLITNAVADGTHAGEWWGEQQYNYATNVITNTGNLTIEKGEIYETAAGSICYAIDNNSSGADAILNINDGYIHKDSGTAVRMFANSTTKKNEVNISGGTVEASYAGLWIQLPGSNKDKKLATLNVTGGTLKGSFAFYDYSYGDLFDNVNYKISGGTVDGDVFSYGANIDISDGEFMGEVAVKQSLPSDIKVTGGKFHDEVYTYGENAVEGFITGGEFRNFDYEYEGVTYNSLEDMEACIAEGLTFAADGNGWATVSEKDYAAQVGDTKYETLAEALEATNEGTVTLLKNVETGGITVASGKNIVLDFNGKTVTFNKPGAGSTGTKTIGFQLLKDSTIEFKNGTITIDESNKDLTWTSTSTEKGIAMLIQNYANLTLTDMNIDGTNIAHNGTAPKYVMSNNSGAVAISGKTDITAVAGDFAFDTCKFGNYAVPTVVVNTTGTITGKIEATGGKLSVAGGTINGEILTADGYTEGDIQISGGTFSSEVEEEYCAEGYIPTANGNGSYGVKAGSYAAQVGDTKYETLAEALEATNEGTVTLLKNVETGGITVASGKNIVLDFNGKTVTFNKPGAGSTGTKTNGFQLLKDSTIEFKNGTITIDESNKDLTWTSTSTEKGIAMLIQNYANLTLTDMNIDGTNIAHNGAATRYVMSNNSGAVVLANATSITAASGDFAFDTCQYGNYTAPTVTVNTTGTITGKIEASGGKLSVAGGTINGTIATEQGYSAGDIAISGGTFSEAVKEEYCAEGFIPMANENGSYGVKAGSYAAKVGETKYETLAEALEAAGAAADAAKTVVLLTDAAEENLTLRMSEKNAILDLNGHTLTSSIAVSTEAASKLQFTIKDTAETKGKLAGDITVTNCKIELSGNAAVEGSFILNNVDTANIKGTVKQTNAEKAAISLNGTTADGLKITNTAVIDAAGTAVKASSGTVKILSNSSTSKAQIGGTLDFAEGVTAKITGGEYTKDPSSVLADTQTAVKNAEGKYEIAGAVAKIGETKYASLQAAFEAADEGTVTLLTDVETGGITVASGKNIVLDFNGKTVTFNKPGAGSTGTKTNGFQLLKDSTIEFKNGTITIDESNKDLTWTSTSTEKGIAMLIQNYANLTLTDMNIDGTNIAHNGAATRYVMSNNSGAVVLANATSITAASGDYAFDTCKFGSYAVPTVVVNTTGTITGKIEASGGKLSVAGGTINGTIATEQGYSAGDIAISGGTFSEAVAEEYCAEGFIPMANENGSYGVKAGSYAAQVGEKKYETLAEALEAAGAATIKLLADAAPTVELANGSGLTIDANGFALTETGITAVTGSAIVKTTNADGSVTYKAYISIDIPTAATGLTYNGSLQTGVAAGTGFTLSAATATDAGNYTAVATLQDGYIWSDKTTEAKNVAWSIAKKTVTIKADDASKTEGDADPELTATVTGAVAGETPVYTVSRESGEAAGTYAVTVTADKTAAVNQNYEITCTAGTFTVNKKSGGGNVNPPVIPPVTPPTVEKYDVAVETGIANGTITIPDENGKAVSSASIEAGKSVVITLTPAEGYEPEKLVVNGNEVAFTVNEDGTATYTIASVDAATTIGGSFMEKVIDGADNPGEKAIDYASTLKLKLNGAKTDDGKIRFGFGPESQKKLKEIQDMGYQLDFYYYKTTKKDAEDSEYTYMSHKIKNPEDLLTPTKGEAGTVYYYKAKIVIRDMDGNEVTSIGLSQIECGFAKWVGNIPQIAKEANLKFNGRKLPSGKTAFYFGEVGTAKLKKIEDMGYTLKFTYYKQDSKTSPAGTNPDCSIYMSASASKTSENGYQMIPTKGENGMYYSYTCMIDILDKDGNMVATIGKDQIKFGWAKWTAETI